MEMKIESKYKKSSEQDKKNIYGLEDQLSNAREQLKILSEENRYLSSQILNLQEVSVIAMSINNITTKLNIFYVLTIIPFSCCNSNQRRIPMVQSNL